LFDPGERQLKPVVKKRPKNRGAWAIPLVTACGSLLTLARQEKIRISEPPSKETAVCLALDFCYDPVLFDAARAIKDLTSTKSQLPFNEGVAVATGTSVP